MRLLHRIIDLPKPNRHPNVSVFRRFYKMIQLIINGQPQHFLLPDQTRPPKSDQNDAMLNITQLLAHMALQGKRIAIERNGEIVPRSKYDEQVLIDGDRLEIVIAVGGG